MELNKIYHGDFTTNTLPDKCANLIISDPPYFEVKGAFDFVWEDMKAYLQDVEKWAKECKRLLADNGTLFWFGSAKNIAYSQVILDEYFTFENNIAIEFNRQTKKGVEEFRCFAPVSERLLMYSLEDENFFIEAQRDYLLNEYRKCGKPIAFYKELCGFTGNQPYNWFAPKNNGKGTWQLPTEEHYKKLQTTGFFQKSYDDLRFEFDSQRRYFNNFMKLYDIMKFDQEAHITKEYDHETVKPETLTRALILTCSRPNDLVVVPFAGSGTECAMAAKEGRRFIGWDIEQKYVEMSNNRVTAILRQPTLFQEAWVANTNTRDIA